MKQSCPATLDRSQLAQLYHKLAPKILRSVQRQVSSAQDAEDILIEVFVAALESASFASLSEHDQQAWLWRVAQNKVIDIYRRGHKRPSLTDQFDDSSLEEISSDPEWISIQHEEVDHLAQLIGRLPPLQQQVLHLRFSENLRCAQIAAKVGKQESSIRALISRALKRLRQYHQEQEKGGHDYGLTE